MIKQTVVVILGILLALALSLLAMPSPRLALAEDGEAVVDLVLLPSSQTVNIGDTFQVTIEAQCNVQDISGIAAFMDFDPDYLEVQSVSPGDTFPTVIENTYDNVAGTINYSAGKLGEPFPSDTFTVATISFEALDFSASTSVSFHTEYPRTTDADYGGESKLRSTTGATVAISNTSSHEGEGLPSRLEPGTTDLSQIVTDEGVFIEATIAQNEDGLCKIMIDKGTVALTGDNKPLSLISITQLEEPSVPPKYAHIIGPIYNLGPDGATFRPSAALIITYESSNMPEGITEEDLVIAWWEVQSGEWVELVSEVHPDTNTITASVGHFTSFTILGYEAVAEPAAFSLSSLNIFPAEVHVGETVTISLVVTNAGSESGSYKITLSINGIPETTRHVTVNAGSSENVAFTVSREQTGNYSVVIDELSGSFTVTEPASEQPAAPAEEDDSSANNWPLIGGIIAAVLVIIGVTILFVARRKAA